MDVAHPYKSVSPTLDGDVLRVLARTTGVLTGREVAALTGRRSHSGVLGALNRLTEHGLVDRVEMNRAYLFTLNREHLAAPAVELLMEMRAELLRRIRGVLDSWEIAPANVSMFGSAARGDGGTASDIDLLVIRPGGVDDDNTTWRTQLADLKDQIRRWTGNYAQIVELADEEFDQLRGDDRAIVAALRSDALVLHGSDISTILGGA
ncbi:MAG TPA: nucleotidyltransferase domain-containing protein [Solirubrobacteraceae bacterium]|nr:nucleotidyltransferase domain-containing protein [Solirubrobacteraceae bacterium]